MAGPFIDGMIPLEEQIGVVDVAAVGTVHDKLDVGKTTADQILQDTADIQPKLGAPTNGTIAQDIADVKTVSDAAAADAAAIKLVVEDVAIGNSAIVDEINANETKIDAVDTKLGEPAGADVSADIAALKVVADAVETDTQAIQTTIGSPANATVSQDVADIKAVVDSINEGQGTFMISIKRTLELPTTGDKWYPFQILCRDSNVPTDLDANPTLTLIDASAGTDYSSLLYDSDKITQTATPSKDSDGVYKGFIKLPSTQSREALTFTAIGLYNTADRYQAVQVEVQEYTEDSFRVTDRSTLDAVLVDTADMQPKLGTPANVSISQDIADVATDVTALDAKVVVVDNVVDGLATNMDLIKNIVGTTGFDRTTDSLEALGNVLQIIASKSFSSKAIIASKNTGNIANGGTELVALGAATPTNGRTGFTSVKANIKRISVSLVSGPATKFTVKGFRDSAGTDEFYDHGREVRVAVGQNSSVDIIFDNTDGTPVSICYIEVTITGGTVGDSVFKVEVDGIELD